MPTSLPDSTNTPPGGAPPEEKRRGSKKGASKHSQQQPAEKHGKKHEPRKGRKGEAPEEEIELDHAATGRAPEEEVDADGEGLSAGEEEASRGASSLGSTTIESAFSEL